MACADTHILNKPFDDYYIGVVANAKILLGAWTDGKSGIYVAEIIKVYQLFPKNLV